MDFYQTEIETPVSVEEGELVAITYRKIGAGDSDDDDSDPDGTVTCMSTVTKTVTPEGWDSVKSFYLRLDDRNLRCRVTSGTTPSVVACDSETGKRKPVGHLVDVDPRGYPGIRITDEMVRSAL